MKHSLRLGSRLLRFLWLYSLHEFFTKITCFIEEFKIGEGVDEGFFIFLSKLFKVGWKEYPASEVDSEISKSGKALKSRDDLSDLSRSQNLNEKKLYTLNKVV